MTKPDTPQTMIPTISTNHIAPSNRAILWGSFPAHLRDIIAQISSLSSRFPSFMEEFQIY